MFYIFVVEFGIAKPHAFGGSVSAYILQPTLYIE